MVERLRSSIQNESRVSKDLIDGRSGIFPELELEGKVSYPSRLSYPDPLPTSKESIPYITPPPFENSLQQLFKSTNYSQRICSFLQA
uniref:Uncharacterized protein n=1 Tax=Picea glauca TaxID=3330 RepID=A0A101LYB4_PICGL|nr:hypothetical protein ABT39_MTgene5797 [Picea glauca]QHR90428.1 hypothetical protein Q903MT_gene4452 [Picea sitchensis]